MTTSSGRRFMGGALCFAALLSLLSVAGSVALAADGLEYPPPGGEWARLETESGGWNEGAVGELLAYAAEQKSSGLVIVHRGRLVSEGNWEPPASARLARMTTGRDATGRAIEDVASVQKSVVAWLVGVAEGRGLVDLEAPVSQYLGEGWSKVTAEQEAAIRVRHLLSMTSGLTPAHTYEVAAGGRWRYNTRVYSRLLGVLEAATDADIHDLTARWLTGPIGMRDSRWTPRPWVESEDANSVGFSTTTSDLARFGLLILSRGEWDGRDLLGNPTFLDRALASSQPHNPAYGYLWWVNGRASLTLADDSDHDGALVPSAPADLVAGIGALGRQLHVVPSLGLVVVRLGDQPPAGRSFNTELWKLLSRAVPLV